MKIAFDVSQTCVERSGCGWFADSLARELSIQCQKSDDRLILYHHFDRWLNCTTETGTNIPEMDVEMPFFNLPRQEAAELWDRINSGAAPPPGEPQIIHANNFNAPACSSGKLVYTIYDVSFWVHPEYTTECNRLHCQDGVLRAMKNADAFLFISENSRREFESTFPGWLEARKKPSTVIPLGTRSLHPPLNRSIERGYWLTVGSLEPRKNHAATLDALEIYWSRSVRKLPLHIAGGSGWKSDALKTRIQRMEAAGKVKYLGYVEDKALPVLYQNALGFIFASWHEGFGLPILEAMSNGCPVISSDRASLPEVGGEAPIYIDPSQPEQIAGAMLRLESDAPLADRHAICGLQQAEKFTWRSAAEQTLAFYHTVMGAGS